MSRDDGFSIADLSTKLLDDPKVRAMARTLNDQGATSTALVLYLASVLASWSEGERVEALDAAPAWMHDTGDALVSLQDAGLLGADGRVPPLVWEAWFRPAWERREARRASGALGGKRSWAEGGGRRSQQSVSVGSASVQQSVSDASPVRPSVPTDRIFSDAEPNGSAPLTGPQRVPPTSTVSVDEAAQYGLRTDPAALAAKMPKEQAKAPMSDQERQDAIAANQAILDEPRATELAKRAAMKVLQRLGAWPDPEAPPKPNGTPKPEPAPRPQVDNPGDNPEADLEVI